MVDVSIIDSKVDMYKGTLTMDVLDASIGYNVPFVSSVNFHDTFGKYCEYTFKGGFKIPEASEYDAIGLENTLLSIMRESVYDVLIVHYNKVCKSFLNILCKGLDASDNFETVTFSFIYNKEKSLNDPVETLTWCTFDNPPVKDPRLLFYMSPEVHNFYDFVIKVKSDEGEKILDKLEGIPHFLVPSFMRMIGIWLWHAKDTKA